MGRWSLLFIFHSMGLDWIGLVAFVRDIRIMNGSAGFLELFTY